MTLDEARPDARTAEPSALSWIDAAAARVLERNHRRGVTPDGVSYSYTRPDRDKFPAQFYWDSCFHALAWARVDPAPARDELRTLLAVQEPDGFIGHTVFWDAPIRASRRLFYNVHRASDRMTRTIQPPFLALAWEEVARASVDEPGFAGEGVAALGAQLDWLDRERAEPDSPLLRVLQPDETGMDAAPQFDELLGPRAAGLPGFVDLVRRSRADGFRLAAVERRGGFVVTDVLVNVAYALSLEALTRMGGDARYATRAADVRAALVERLYDPRGGLFFSRGPRGLLRTSTWSSLSPLALPELPSEIAGRLIEEHLLDPARYDLPFPVPSTAADERAFRPNTRLLRYWRGPTWLAGTWLLQRGLLAHGRVEAARSVAVRTASLVARSGFREYYDPYTGVGMGARAFGMSTLAAVIVAAAGA